MSYAFDSPDVWVVGAAGDAEAKALVAPLQDDVLALPLVLAAIRLPEENKDYNRQLPEKQKEALTPASTHDPAISELTTNKVPSCLVWNVKAYSK